MDRQNLPFRSRDSLQQGMQSSYPPYFPQQPQASLAPPQSYTAAHSEVDRWSNWVKFISVYLFLKGLISLISLIPSLVAAMQMNDKGFMNLQLITLGLVLYVIALGVVGYWAGKTKSSGAAKCYMQMLFVLIGLEAIYLYYLAPWVAAEICRDIEKDQTEFQCDNDFYQMFYIVLAAAYVISMGLMCVPTIMCPCKMYRNARIVEQGHFQSGQNVQNVQMMHMQGRSYNHVVGYPMQQ